MVNVNRVGIELAAGAAAVCLFAGAAFAHNPQIQIGIDGGRIVTYGLFGDGPYQTPTAARRVYEIPLGQRSVGDANDGWYAEPNHTTYPYAGPGVALLDGQFAGGSILKVSYVDGLKWWNGSSFVDPGTEQFATSTTSSFSTSVLTKDAGPFNSISLSAVGPTADEHKTLRWRLLGDGGSPNTASDDGVYLLSLQLSTTQSGVSASLPYYFLLVKNASPAESAAALAFVSTNLVPEPCMGVLVAAAGLLLRRRR